MTSKFEWHLLTFWTNGRGKREKGVKKLKLLRTSYVNKLKFQGSSLRFHVSAGPHRPGTIQASTSSLPPSGTRQTPAGTKPPSLATARPAYPGLGGGSYRVLQLETPSSPNSSPSGIEIHWIVQGCPKECLLGCIVASSCSLADSFWTTLS